MECHRTLLVARNLVARGVAVAHILADGGLESYDDAMLRLVEIHKLPPNGDMFRTPADVIEEAPDPPGAEVRLRRRNPRPARLTLGKERCETLYHRLHQEVRRPILRSAPGIRRKAGD